MAAIAREEGVCVEIIVDGKIIRVSREIPSPPKKTVELPDDFAL